MTLNQSIEGCKNRDPESQKRLYELLSGKMYAICLRYCKEPNDAADVLQDGFVKVFKNIGQYRAEGNFEAWVRVIMVRTALALLRKKKLFVSIHETKHCEQEYEMDIDFDSHRYERLLEIIQSLPVGYRTVFNLFVFEEMRHAEIAAALNCTEGTSKSQLYKARKMLQEQIEKDRHLDIPLVKRS